MSSAYFALYGLNTFFCVTADICLLVLVLLQKKNCDNFISFSAVLVIIADKLKEQVVKISKNDLTGNLAVKKVIDFCKYLNPSSPKQKLQQTTF